MTTETIANNQATAVTEGGFSPETSVISAAMRALAEQIESAKGIACLQAAERLDAQAVEIERLKRAAHRFASDPMDWPLPCDVTVGAGTVGKGVALRVLVSRMKTLYELATGKNADEVANRTPEQRAALAKVFLANAATTTPPTVTRLPSCDTEGGEA